MNSRVSKGRLILETRSHSFADPREEWTPSPFSLVIQMKLPVERGRLVEQAWQLQHVKTPRQGDRASDQQYGMGMR